MLYALSSQTTNINGKLQTAIALHHLLGAYSWRTKGRCKEISGDYDFEYLVHSSTKQKLSHAPKPLHESLPQQIEHPSSADIPSYQILYFHTLTS